MEIWDAYDSSFRKQNGKTLIRGERIPYGLYHLVCDILVRHADGTYLLMLRDRKKKHGGLWEASAGGSAVKGETPMQCAMRELEEETGIVAKTIQEIGRECNPKTRALYVEYLCITDTDKNSIILQEGETAGFQWVDREKLLAMRGRGLSSGRILKYIEELRKDD